MSSHIDPSNNRLLTNRQRNRNQFQTDHERRLAKVEALKQRELADVEALIAYAEAKQQKSRSLLNTSAVATVSITGLTLAAVFAFSGAIWANPSTPMLRVCADALYRFSIVFIISLTAYVIEMVAGLSTKSISERISSEIKWTIGDTCNVLSIFMIGIAIVAYTLVGIYTSHSVFVALRNEASLFNNEGTVKSAAPPSEPAELKPLGEFRTPSWFSQQPISR